MECDREWRGRGRKAGERKKKGGRGGREGEGKKVKFLATPLMCRASC